MGLKPVLWKYFYFKLNRRERLRQKFLERNNKIRALPQKFERDFDRNERKIEKFELKEEGLGRY